MQGQNLHYGLYPDYARDCGYSMLISRKNLLGHTMY